MMMMMMNLSGSTVLRSFSISELIKNFDLQKYQVRLLW